MHRALVVLVLGACAADPSSTIGGGGKADGSEPTIAFRADYSQKVTGQLLAGSPVRIRYDLDRVTDCRSDAWGVSGYAQFDGAGEPVVFGVSRIANGDVVPVDAELELPASASHVQIWFEVNDKYGCHAYDSNEGANYQFDIDRHGLGAVLAWDAGGFSQSGAVHAGDKVTVHYDPSRLSQCAGTTGGHAAWGVSGHYAVDGGATHDIAVTHAENDALVASDPTLTVPRGHDLALWFEATNVWGCHAYDSAYGDNYHVTIE
jgi:Family of unknown function (DUF6209)